MSSAHLSRGGGVQRRIQPHRRAKDQRIRHQQLLLDDLNDHVLAIVVDFLFEIDELNGQHLTLYDNPGPYFQTHRSTLNLSVVNKRLRAICIPKLFRDIHRHSKTMGQLNRQLKDIELDVQILASVRTCEIVTSSWGESPLCRTRLPWALEAMPFLKELSITHRKVVDFSGVEMTFAVARKRLPTVTGLRIQCGGDWYFLIAACYNTEILVLRDSLACGATMSEVSKLKNLRHLELYKRRWNDVDIEIVHECVPDIESLALKGGIEDTDFTVSVALSNLLSDTEYSAQKWVNLFASFKRLHTLAIPIEEAFEEWRYVDSFSDNSLVAESIILNQRANGTDIDQRSLSRDFFEQCHVLETLWFWEFASAPWPWTAVRDASGNVMSVSCDLYEDDFDWDRNSSHYETLDRDDFPLVLSFPREITSFDERWDPPRYGRDSKAEWEEREAIHADDDWYTSRWMRTTGDPSSAIFPGTAPTT